ncbi:hypothetical protein PF005_g20470 [Phytophthora fragariae]|uniref:Uncharacterized protein n=1 Tax=Phytophthora fragariae TaxID=53985 RepID=A0A6A3I519_9STRA|nr:hypothetical protein PF003_g36351 [Phytophthora fragariae]KAE8926129.1 hypothetical protein PF009_g23676 [Phytophthora fragariae]KAE8975163.1 hypothetical protein PF011_g24588 [Phytophthora fragariae]KAE9083914.1 hypothetical protein PF007_g21718 [Phytophthora fragariae]KAE9086895.1 hypothetical protein PF010_g19927 [Phytophthora fragariae]
MSSGGQSYGGYGGAYYSPPTEYGGYGRVREKTPPGRRPSGFKPMYTGAEVRRSDSPVYGWNQTAWPAPPREPLRPFGWTPSTGWSSAPAANAPAKVVIKKEKTKKLAAKKATTVATTAATVKPSTVPAPKKKKSTKNRVSPATKGGMTAGVNAWNATPFPAQPTATVPVNLISVSQATSHAVKVLPFFYSDLTTVERARTFWEAFEENTEGLPDKSRLLVFQQKLKGREAERWWNNSHIKTFKTLKVRFHNHFLSRTADELWERLHSTKRQKGESIEEWGDRVTDLCDSLDYPDARMRYQLFRRGLNNRWMLAILDLSPVRDIPEACEWLMVKDMYRPVDEDDDFEEAVPSKSAAASETPAILKPMADQVKALAQEVRSFVKEEKEWRNKVNNELCAPPHPHYAMQTMTATSYAATAAKERSRVPWYSYGR